MFPWFHPNFVFETLLQWSWSNPHKPCQSLSFWRNLSIVIQTSSCPASSKKPSLSTYPLIHWFISIHWWSQQLSSNFKPQLHFQNARKSRCLLHSISPVLLLFVFSFSQSAYRIFHSTEPTLLKIHNDLTLVMDRGEVTCILLDLFAAFDTVDHSILLTRLHNWFGFDGLSLNWSSSHLASRSQTVSINDSISAFSTLSCGVPQSFVLGPLLFTLEIVLLGSML